MQPIIDSRIQQQTIPTHQRTHGRGESTSNAVKTPLRVSTGILPEDMVTLTKDRLSTLSQKKEPSAPVTSAENKALRDNFSVYA
jgi:hypothetical protein